MSNSSSNAPVSMHCSMNCHRISSLSAAICASKACCERAKFCFMLSIMHRSSTVSLRPDTTCSNVVYSKIWIARAAWSSFVFVCTSTDISCACIICVLHDGHDGHDGQWREAFSEPEIYFLRRATILKSHFLCEESFGRDTKP